MTRLEAFTKTVDRPERPDTVPDFGVAVVVWIDSTVGWLCFQCPCGCGAPTYLPLSAKAHEVHWEWKDGNPPGTITISPSVHNLTCGAHFFIRDSRIEWC